MSGQRASSDPDAVVVGSGPNGLVAAITLARAGRRVLVLEAASRPGGGLRSEALTEPGFVHDACAAVLPLGIASPALGSLDLTARGLRWVHPPAAVAHPLDDGRCALLGGTVADTAARLGPDASAYRSLLGPLVRDGAAVTDTLLHPRRLPRSPWAAARFGVQALRSAAGLANARFATDEARALLAGLAGHAVLPLDAPATAGYALFLGLLGHTVGWPIVEGGTGRLADALVAELHALGSRVETGVAVRSLDELPPARAVVLDLTPRQVLRIAGSRLPERYARALARFRYGPGAFKLDWALDGPIPWRAEAATEAATVHLGGTLPEIAAAEAAVQAGRHPSRPYVIVVQPTRFDPTRAPAGRHVAWAYCHVPIGSAEDQTGAVEDQLERFAPGFRDLVRVRHVRGPAALEAHDANCVGGDVNGGAGDLRQLLARPVWSRRPWATPVPGLYLCSASTPPGGGVHGMCGWHAARAVLADER